MAEIDWNAPTVAPRVGEYAEDRRGTRCGPIKRSPLNGRFSFTDGVNKSWDESGRYCGRGHHKFDLIAIIPAPDSVEPDSAEPDAVTTVHTVERRATINEVGGGRFVVSQADGVWPFGISTGDGIGFSASKPAAVAIARAILRMAGESK